MIIRRVPVRDYMEVNSYFYIDGETGHGFLIDPGAQGGRLLRIAGENGWTVDRILLTHGHFDHIGGIAEIRAVKDIPVLIHEAGLRYLADPHMNLSESCPPPLTVQGAGTFRDGDVLSPDGAPDCRLRVIHTPGHTEDSVIFYDEKNGAALTGDTIFRSGWGNTQFPGGDERQLFRSIRERVLTLPEDTVLYSGHSDETTVGREKRWYL